MADRPLTWAAKAQVVGRPGYGPGMRSSPWLVGAILSAVLILLVLLIGGPTWAIAMGFVAVFLVMLMMFGTRE